MLENLTCPVCERSQLEQNICPNCETDLSIYGMLLNLPRQTLEEVEQQKLKPIILIWLPVAILFLLLGLSLGFASNLIIFRQQPPIAQSSTQVTVSLPEVKPDQLVAPKMAEMPKKVEPEAIACGGFNYVVRRGDSLSLIASRLYGDRNLWSLIKQANPSLKNRESAIAVGELLFIPNLKHNCLNN
jgi:hypothetical protein